MFLSPVPGTLLMVMVMMVVVMMEEIIQWIVSNMDVYHVLF